MTKKKLGEVCSDCGALYAAIREAPDKCICGSDDWRPAKRTDVVRHIKDLQKLIGDRALEGAT